MEDRMPLRKPHSTETEYVHRMTRSHRHILERTILAPAIKEDVIEARIIHLGLWTYDSPQIRLHWGAGQRRALDWLAERLEDFRWREHEYPVTEIVPGDLRDFEEKASKIAADIRFELSDARQDTLADPRERAS